MKKNINEIMLNPIRMRIIQELAKVKSSTTGEICKKISDIPRTTMYRHIKILIENNLLSVISEEKVRGIYEREISLNIPEITKHNTIENADSNALGFLLSIYSNLHRYFSKDNPEPGKDRIFMNNTVLMMNDEEFDKFAEEFRELLLKYSLEPGNDRKARSISIISAPGDKE